MVNMYQENNMIIDLTKLVTSNISKEDINININFADKIKESTIIELNDCRFIGDIKKIDRDNFELNGCISGVMVVPDNVTLEAADYKFSTEISEKINVLEEETDNSLTIVKNRLDITDFLWQNILVEIPLRVTNHDDLTLKGDGWCLTTEEEIKKRHVEDSPFGKLSEIFSSEEE